MKAAEIGRDTRTAKLPPDRMSDWRSDSSLLPSQGDQRGRNHLFLETEPAFSQFLKHTGALLAT